MDEQNDFGRYHNHCFLPPCKVEELPDDLKESGDRPVLHLLRRDLEQLYRKENYLQSDEADKHRAPFLAVAGITIGIDMMSDLFCGEGKDVKDVMVHFINRMLSFLRMPLIQSGIGKKFKQFLLEVGSLPKEHVEVLWNLRCSLVHTYSLRPRDRKYRKKGFSITTEAPTGILIENLTSNNTKAYKINFWELKKLFLTLIDSYKNVLVDMQKDDLPDMRERFIAAMKRRGYINAKST